MPRKNWSPPARLSKLNNPDAWIEKSPEYVSGDFFFRKSGYAATERTWRMTITTLPIMRSLAALST